MADKVDGGWDELKGLQDTLLKVWQMYVAWFTWSLSLNLLAISYITTRETVRPDFLTGLAVIMVLAIMLSVGAGILMQKYHLKMIARADSLIFLPERPKPDVQLIMGGDIGLYAAWTVPAMHLAALVGWLCLVAKYGSF